MEGLQGGVPGAVRVRLSPSVAERTLRGPAGPLLERTLVLRSLPGAVVQWRGAGLDGARDRERELRLAWRAPLAAGTQIPDAPEPDARLLEIPGADGGRFAFAVLPGPGAWRVAPQADNAGLRVGVRLPAGAGPVTLVVAGDASDPRAAAAVLRRLRHLDAELRVRRTRPGTGPEGRLSLQGPPPRTVRALAWADARLEALAGPEADGGVLRPPSRFGPGCPTDPRWIWAGHGLLAAGRFRGARRLLAQGASWLPDADDDAPSGAPDAWSALYLHLAARYLRWSGAPGLPGPARKAARRVEEALVEVAPVLLHRGATAVAAAAALAELSAARDGPGREPDDGPAREAARGLERRMAASRGAGVSLPVLGSGATGARRAGSGTTGPPPAPTLAAVLGVPFPDGDGGPATGGLRGGATEGVAPGLEAWAAWGAGEPERAFRLWRGHLESGVDGRRGLWPPQTSGPGGGAPCLLDAGAVGAAVAPLLFGFLGAEADAAFGRLRLAPRLPGAWEAFEIRGVRMGDVRVGLRYRRDGPRHTFVLTPTAGRVPPNLVFEPLLPLEGIGGVRVDGEAADLDRHRTGRWTGVRLQLPLDSVREVTVDGDEHA